MKRLFLLSLLSAFLLIPSVSQAQVMIGPGPLNPLGMRPIKTGLVHEGSLALIGFSGDASQDYPVGGAAFYSGLIRPAPNFAYGLHIGGGSMDDFEGSSHVELGFLGGEGRFYIPIDPYIDLWASAAIGIGMISESFVADDGYEYEGDSFVKLAAAFGVGVDYFISPSVSLGGYVRAYRLLYNNDQNVQKTEEQIKVEDYYGVWMTFGASISLHY